MCTNFTPTKRAQWGKDKFGVDLPANYPDESYPGFAAPLVVKSHQTGRVASGLARFGLIPFWAKDDKIARHTYNARSETVSEKPSYRTAWRHRQYGLVLGLDNKIGSIEPGKLADFTVLDQDPHSVRPEAIRDIPVWGTVLGGVVYPASEIGKQ